MAHFSGYSGIRPKLSVGAPTDLNQSIGCDARSLTDILHSSYSEGIRFAKEAGHITMYTSASNPEQAGWSHIDEDGHSLNLKLTNTSGVNPLPQLLAELYRDVDRPKFLELGAGAGLACSIFSRLVPQAEIQSVGWTPINPFLRFREDFDRMNPPVEPEQIYEPVDTPYITHQYIGNYPDEVKLSNSTFHFVYDCYGPLQKCGLGSRWKRKRHMTAAIHEAVHSLNPLGSLLIEVNSSHRKFYDLLFSIAKNLDNGSHLISTEDYRTIICTRSESPLS